MKFRREQMEAFENHALKDFQRRVRDNLQETFPDVCRKLGAPTVAASVEDGCARAAEYGMRIEMDVMRYIELMYVLHHEFDRDPQYRWLNEILADRRLSPEDRLDRIGRRLGDKLGETEEHNAS